MKRLRLRFLPLAGLLAAPALAFAHPGHEGGHDFEWDFGHFASHPLATTLCVAVLAISVWAVWRLVKSKPAAARASRPDRSPR
jgi:hydrogenase/urease accessory protein HupE